MNRAIIILICAVMILPIWFMLTGSLKDTHGIFVMPPRLIPRSATLDNYARLLSEPPLLWWVLNTLIVATATVVLSVFISCTAGYAFAFYAFPGKKLLWMFLLAGIMVPRISILVPLFVVMNKLRISGSVLAVILSTAYSPLGLFLSRRFFSTLPMSILESARLDGSTEWQVLTRIVMPVARPIVTALALFAGIGALTDYMWQMLILQRERSQTLLVGLIRTVMVRGGDVATNLNPIGQSLAAGTLLLIPLLVIFIMANKYFTSALGGVE